MRDRRNPPVVSGDVRPKPLGRAPPSEPRSNTTVDRPPNATHRTRSALEHVQTKTSDQSSKVPTRSTDGGTCLDNVLRKVMSPRMKSLVFRGFPAWTRATGSGGRWEVCVCVCLWCDLGVINQFGSTPVVCLRVPKHTLV